MSATKTTPVPTKSTISMLKSLASPPQQIKELAAAVVILLGDYHVTEEDEAQSSVRLSEKTYPAFKKTLSDFKVCERLQNFDPKTVNPVQVKLAKHASSQITMEEIKKKSFAAAELLKWVQHVLANVEG